MKKYILFGLILAVAVSAWAVTKHESRQTEAQSMVLYGSNGTVILPLLLDDAGKLVANFSAMNFTQNATGLYWNLSNDTSVSKTAASLVTQWMNGTSNNASTALSVMSAGSLTERINFTGTNQIILLNTTTLMPSADGTSAVQHANSTGGVYWTEDSTNKRILIGLSPISYGIQTAGNPWLANITGDLALGSKQSINLFLDVDNNTANTALTVYGNNTTTSAAIPYFTIIEPGNVGIGTTAPTGKLSIIGGPAYSQALCLNATGALSNCSSVVGATGGCTCP
jgi:hypothetical protein